MKAVADWKCINEIYTYLTIRNSWEKLSKVIVEELVQCRMRVDKWIEYPVPADLISPNKLQ